MLMPSIFSDNFVESIFDDLFTPRAYGCKTANRVAAMNADVKEKKDSYEITMDLPGFSKEDIKAELFEGNLTISAKHQEEKKEEGKDERYIHRERYFGEMQRSFFVGEDITEADIHAAFENGVLSITIPKKEEEKKVPEKKLIAIEG